MHNNFLKWLNSIDFSSKHVNKFNFFFLLFDMYVCNFALDLLEGEFQLYLKFCGDLSCRHTHMPLICEMFVFNSKFYGVSCDEDGNCISVWFILLEVLRFGKNLIKILSWWSNSQVWWNLNWIISCWTMRIEWNLIEIISCWIVVIW